MLKRKEECRSLLESWLEIYLTVEFVYYHAADDETKAYTINIDLSFFIFDRWKQLEKFTFVFLFNSNTFINDKNPNLRLWLILNFNLYLFFIFCVFDGVWKKIKENLLQPLLIRLDEVFVYLLV